MTSLSSINPGISISLSLFSGSGLMSLDQGERGWGVCALRKIGGRA